MQEKQLKVTIGRKKICEIPQSMEKAIISLIEESTKIENNTSLNDDILKITKKLCRRYTKEEKNKIAQVLFSIGKKFGMQTVKQIPHTFPFLNAIDKLEYDLMSLDAGSRYILNWTRGQTGRGEIAVALLWGITDFDKSKEDDEKYHSKSYDLILADGNQCDVKDYRWFSTETNSFKFDSRIRLGSTSSKLLIDKIDKRLKSALNFNSSISRFGGIATSDFTSQKALIEKLCENIFYNTPLGKDQISYAINHLFDVLDEDVSYALNEVYPGGIFTISDSLIKFHSSNDFHIYDIVNNKARITRENQLLINVKESVLSDPRVGAK